MTRRESFQRIALLLGGVAIAPELLAKALEPATSTLKKMGADRLQLLDEMAETIIPTTDTPGAKAAQVGAFMVHAVEYCLPEKQKERFWADLNTTEAACVQQHGKSFIDCSEAERITFFQHLEAQKPAPGKEADAPTFFYSLKMLVLYGYFTSEIGATQALNYDPVPGEWIADMPVQSDTKAWTPMF